MTTEVLTVRGLEVFYGHGTAVNGIDFRIRRGQLVALLGANGAGKTSTINALSGLAPHRAQVCDIMGHFVQVPEGRQLFGDLTVLDNLLLGAWSRRGRSTDALDEVLALFPKLRSMADRQAGTLSGGEQQMVAIGRALMARPDILAIDELSLGLAPKIVKSLARFLQETQRRLGISVLLVEQNVRLALELANWVYVLENGRIKYSGPPERLASAEGGVESIYFGEQGQV